MNPVTCPRYRWSAMATDFHTNSSEDLSLCEKGSFRQVRLFFCRGSQPGEQWGQIQRKFKTRCFGTNALTKTGVKDGCSTSTAGNWRDTRPSFFEVGWRKRAIVVPIRQVISQSKFNKAILGAIFGQRCGIFPLAQSGYDSGKTCFSV